jgi:DNA-binding SARP family transcriptional activator
MVIMDSVSGSAGVVEFRVLGAIELPVDGVVADIGGARQRRLLAALIARAGTVVGTDALVDMVWDDDERPDHAAQAVRTHVSRLRQALTSSGIDTGRVLVTEPPGYRLALSDGQLGSARFGVLIDVARPSHRGSDPRTSLGSLDEAMTLWRGEPYAEFSDRPRVEAEVARLTELSTVALEERIAARIALGARAEVVGDLEQLAAADTLRARPVELLLAALFRSDRQAEALRVAHRYRQALAEVGLEPSANITELEARTEVADAALLVSDTEELDREQRPESERADANFEWLAIRRGDRRAGCALLSNCQELRRELGRVPTISQVTIDLIIDDIDALPPPNTDADLDDTIRMARALVGR